MLISIASGFDKTCHIVPTALLVRVQCFRKSLYTTVEGLSTRKLVLLMITGSPCRRRRRLTFFATRQDAMHCAFGPPLLDSTKVLLDNFIRNMLLKFRVIDGEYIVKISKGIFEHVLTSNRCEGDT